jgi:hypothetical protein
MTEDINPPEEDFQIRCPRLGHHVSFSYCSRENLGLPCGKSLDCWYRYFPVTEYLGKKLSPDQWKSVFEPEPKPKILNILELIEKAKKVR